LAIFTSTAFAADELYLVSSAEYQSANATSNFSFQIGNVSKQYAYTVMVNYTGPTQNSFWYVVDFVMPYGVVPVGTPATVCNGTAHWRVLQPFAYYGCQIRMNSWSANLTNVTLMVTANMSAYTSANLTNPKQPLYFWANVSTNLTNNVTYNTTADPHYAASTPVNPRPFFNALTDVPALNSSGVFITNWNMTDSYYAVDVPLMSFNSTAGMPQVRNSTLVDVMYQNGMMAERPSFMRLWGYNLTFMIYNMTNTTDGYYYTYSVRTPVNSTLHPGQTLMPLLIYNQTQTDFMSNSSFNITMGTPSQTGFSVWVGSTQYTDSTAAANGLNISFTPQSQDTTGFLTVNIPAASAAFVNNSQISVLFTLTNVSGPGAGGSSSPIYVTWQSVDGLSYNSPPQFGSNITFSYTANISNALNNYTLYNLTLRYFLPLNVTLYNSSGGSGNYTFTISNGTQMYWYNYSAAGGANWTAENILSRTNCTNVTDIMPNSPAYGSTICLCFKVLERQLYHDDFALWQPNASASNATIKLNGTLSFPVMSEVQQTTNLPGSVNFYNATFSSSTTSNINLTDKVPGIETAGYANTQIYLDGSLVTGGVNYTLGSLTVNNVGSGTHTISVSYSQTGLSSSGSGSSSQPCGACTLDGICRLCCAYDPDCPTGSPTPSSYPVVPTPTVLEITPTPSAEQAEEGWEPTPAVEETGEAGEAASAELASANAYIGDARAGMLQAQAKGYDVSDVQRLIGLAEQARDAGDYAKAKEYAQQAQDLVTAKMSAQMKKAGASDWMPIAAVLAVLVIGGAWYFFGRKK